MLDFLTRTGHDHAIPPVRLPEGEGTAAGISYRVRGAGPPLALDVSPYFLREARQLARQEGHGDQIAFREGQAEALPLPESSVDVALSSTVLEEGDADRMLAELIRVTRPGGRIGVIVRATDIPELVSAPLGAATKAKVEAPGLFGAGVVASGCADPSLYARFRAAGLTDLHLFPQLTAVNPDDPRFPMFRQQALGVLAGDEVAEWRRAVAEAEAAGTLFIAMPHHCAVGTKQYEKRYARAARQVRRRKVQDQRPVLRPSNCHCSMCRKQHGAAFRSHARVHTADFKWLAGGDLVRFYESSPGTYRGFCSALARLSSTNSTNARNRRGSVRTPSRISASRW